MSDSTNVSDESKNKIASIRFVVCSILGVVIFFVNLPLGGKSVLPIDWISSLFTTALAPYGVQVMMLSTAIFIYFTVKKKFWNNIKKNTVGFFFDCLGIMALVLVYLQFIKICPEFFTQRNLLGGGINTMSRIFISIVVIMFFIPLLTDYGLPEFIGVFVRPICRKVWDVPGRTAVTIVSAFLGNFTVGHMQANKFYLEGKSTHKEALIVALGFSTPSIGLILSVVSAAGLMHKFTIIVAGILFAVLFITAITVHIPPLSKYPAEYYPGVTPMPEDYKSSSGNVFKDAYLEGVEAALLSHDKQPLTFSLKFGVKSIPMVSNVASIGLGSIVFFGLIDIYTPIFTWIGMLFYPVLSLMGLQPDLVAPNMGLGMVSTLVSQTNIATAEAALEATKIFGIGCVIVIIMFFGSFAASLFSTKITIKMRDYVIIYFQRAYLTILIFGALAHLIARL